MPSPSNPWCVHARVLEGVAKSQSPLKAVVFKSQQPCPDTVSLHLDPLQHSGVGVGGGAVVNLMVKLMIKLGTQVCPLGVIPQAEDRGSSPLRISRQPLHPKPCTPNPKPQTPHPTPQTPNPTPHTPHPTPKPQTPNTTPQNAGGAATPATSSSLTSLLTSYDTRRFGK